MKIRSTIYFSIIITVFFLSGCVMNKMDNSHKTLILKKSVSGKNITIALKKGKYYTNRMQVGPVVFNVLPQIAIWAEDGSGNFIETLYISGADYKEMRHGAKSRKGEEFYRDYLPLWASAVESAGHTLPSKKQPYPDSVTSATPMSSFTVKTAIPDNPGSLVLFAEINKSADYNNTYTSGNSGSIGQPSVIYSVDIDAAEEKRYTMELVGSGPDKGDPPKLKSDISGLDSARKQVESITVIID